MENTWNYDLIDLLDKARSGNKTELDHFLEIFAPLAAVNENQSMLLVLRKFHANIKDEEIRTLNYAPTAENFQFGITIVKASEHGCSRVNSYLPNNLNYKGLKIQDNEVEIITYNKSYITNEFELSSKLSFFGSFTQGDVENGFDNLCNEQYKTPGKPEVEHQTITLPASTITLTYNEELNWYEGNIAPGNSPFNIYLQHTTPVELKKLIGFADNQMKLKFYESMLLKMESKMVSLKNDAWLDTDEDTGKEAQPITAENLRSRISISSIVFYEDCSAVIYCDDDDIFWGHSIEIRVDAKGKYEDANLAG